jgi:hypothetical protein
MVEPPVPGAQPALVSARNLKVAFTGGERQRFYAWNGGERGNR